MVRLKNFITESEEKLARFNVLMWLFLKSFISKNWKNVIAFLSCISFILLMYYVSTLKYGEERIEEQFSELKELFIKDDHKSLIIQASSFIEKYPEHKFTPEVYSLLAQAKFKASEFSKRKNDELLFALVYSQTARDIGFDTPEDRELRLKICKLLKNTLHISTAIKELRDLHELSGKENPIYTLYLADFLSTLKLKDKKKIKDLLQECFSNTKDHEKLKTLVEIARILSHIGEDKNALKILNSIILDLNNAFTTNLLINAFHFNSFYKILPEYFSNREKVSFSGYNEIALETINLALNISEKIRDFQSAKEFVKKIIFLYPKIEPHSLMVVSNFKIIYARYLYLENKLSEAIAELLLIPAERLSEKNKVDFYFLLGNILIQAKKYVEAISIHLKAVEKIDGAVPKEYFEINRFCEIYEDLIKTIEKPSVETFEKLDKLLSIIYEKFEDLDIILKLLINFNETAGNFFKTLSQKSALEDDFENEKKFGEFYRRYFNKTGNLRLRLLEKSLIIEPTEYFKAGNNFLEAENFILAKDSYKKFLGYKLDMAQEAEVLYRIGICWKRLGNFQNAISNFEKCFSDERFKIEPTYSFLSKLEIASLYNENENYPLAIETYETILKQTHRITPEHFAYKKSLLGIVETSTKLSEKLTRPEQNSTRRQIIDNARVKINEIRLLCPNETEFLFITELALGKFSFIEKNVDEAILHYKRAIDVAKADKSIRKKYLNTYYTILMKVGQIYFNEKKYQEALDEFLRTHRLLTNVKESYWSAHYIALCYERLNQSEKANIWHQNAKRILESFTLDDYKYRPEGLKKEFDENIITREQ